MNKYLVLIAVMAVLTLGVWWWKSSDKKMTPVIQPNIANHLMQISPNPSPVSTKPDVSNQALDQDFQIVQRSLTNLDSEQKTANTDSSSQDTPGNY